MTTVRFKIRTLEQGDAAHNELRKAGAVEGIEYEGQLQTNGCIYFEASDKAGYTNSCVIDAAACEVEMPADAQPDMDDFFNHLNNGHILINTYLPIMRKLSVKNLREIKFLVETELNKRMPKDRGENKESKRRVADLLKDPEWHKNEDTINRIAMEQI
jgi:hypothetical protein